MGEGNAKTLVFASGGLLIGLALLSGKESTFRRVWAASLWTTLLAVVADVAPQVVGPFALLIIVAAIATDQGVFGKFVAGTGSTAATTKPATSTVGG